MREVLTSAHQRLAEVRFAKIRRAQMASLPCTKHSRHSPRSNLCKSKPRKSLARRTDPDLSKSNMRESTTRRSPTCAQVASLPCTKHSQDSRQSLTRQGPACTDPRLVQVRHARIHDMRESTTCRSSTCEAGLVTLPFQRKTSLRP